MGIEATSQAIFVILLNRDQIISTYRTFLPIQHQAIDRDFNYLELAQAELTIIPPWYFNEWIAFPSITGILALIFVSINSSFQYLRKKPEAILTQERMYKIGARNRSTTRRE